LHISFVPIAAVLARGAEGEVFPPGASRSAHGGVTFERRRDDRRKRNSGRARNRLKLAHLARLLCGSLTRRVAARGHTARMADRPSRGVRFKSGGVINPSADGTRYDASGGGERANDDAASARRRPPAWAAGAVPRAARANASIGAKLGSSNVGFRMLRAAGWREGEGLGKEKQGAKEPLRVWKKGDRRGLGTESDVGHVVGDPDAEGGASKRPKREKKTNSKAAGGEGDGGDGAEPLPPEVVTARVRTMAKDAQDKARATALMRAFKEEEPTVDANPLLRKRKERDKRGGEGDMSANNPLRGLF
jgi:hypothetical protein